MSEDEGNLIKFDEGCNDLLKIDISVEQGHVKSSQDDDKISQGLAEKYAKYTSSWKEKILSSIPEEELAGLSKNQRKKLYKKKVLQESRKVKRREERERKKLKKRELREAGLEVPRKLKLRDYKDLIYSNYKVVVDLDFYELMAENDLRMVIKQINSCYSQNRKAQKPLQLYATSLVGPMKELFTKLQPGSPSWIMHLEESKYTELFPLDNIVYLTSDSENTLETIEEDKIYVIGGIVDHNQHKGLCHRLANNKGVTHARLPISKYINMSTRKVLTINHVFGILSKYLDTGDWKDAFFSILPQRKGLSEIDDVTMDDNESEENIEDKEDKVNIKDEKCAEDIVREKVSEDIADLKVEEHGTCKKKEIEELEREDAECLEDITESLKEKS